MMNIGVMMINMYKENSKEKYEFIIIFFVHKTIITYQYFRKIKKRKTMRKYNENKTLKNFSNKKKLLSAHRTKPRKNLILHHVKLHKHKFNIDNKQRLRQLLEM